MGEQAFDVLLICGSSCAVPGDSGRIYSF